VGGYYQLFSKENGKFIMAEFHPVVWMFDDEFTKVTYNYFNEKPIIETYGELMLITLQILNRNISCGTTL
jgi:hypothetical protein